MRRREPKPKRARKAVRSPAGPDKKPLPGPALRIAKDQKMLSLSQLVLQQCLFFRFGERKKINELVIPKSLKQSPVKLIGNPKIVAKSMAPRDTVAQSS